MLVSDNALEVAFDPADTVLALQGADVDVELRLDGAAGTWFDLHGHITRIRAANHSVVIAIDKLPAELAHLIAQRGSDRRSRIDVLVADADSARRGAVASAFRGEGCRVREAATVLDAIELLDGSGGTIDLIVVADTMPTQAGDDFRAYLDAAELRAEVIAVGVNDDWVASRARLDPSIAGGQLSQRVKSLLATLFSGRDHDQPPGVI